MMLKNLELKNEPFKMTSLDIGCGDKPRGHINIDRDKPVQKINNFVLADAHYLPFNHKSFNKIICFHVLEHCKNPYQVLTEIQRVCNGIIYIKVPSKHHSDSGDEHIFSWNQNTLRNLLSLVFPEFSIHYTERPFFNRNRKLAFLNGFLMRLGFCREIYGCVKNG